ncbi:TPA: linear amide C-N hydrolase [Klebsiella oxytoca]|uniref:Linear amide C-N hydrolase n=1 Tax=Klebsiella oxytoca TaxID=571 RepID=A0AAN5RCC0_KLEOX|nr:linear amide C-N hydrolase [Klebsiella oxytoca]
MRVSVLSVLMFGSVTLAMSADSSACTRVFMNMYPGYMVSARNLDYFGPADPSLVITPRGVTHTGGNGNNVARWTVHYGSIAIYADNIFPMDGMNEKGLAAHSLYYENGELSQKDNINKPVIESSAWVGYILDNYSSVQEAVNGLKNNVRLVAKKLPIDYDSDTKHLAIEDKSGDSAIIEIDKGTVHIYHNRNYRVMTNPPSYPEQLKNFQKYSGLTDNDMPGGTTAGDRFVRASHNLMQIPSPDNKEQAQGFIEQVINSSLHPLTTKIDKDTQDFIDLYAKYGTDQKQNKGYGTYWTTVADLSHSEYHFKSVSAISEVFVPLSKINFSKGHSIKRIRHIYNYAQKGWEGNLLHRKWESDND